MLRRLIAVLLFLASTSWFATAQISVDEKNLRQVMTRWPANAKDYDTIDLWDVSRVTDFSNLFAGKVGINPNIGGWDVSSATNMRFMFDTCEQFNRDISGWQVGKVTDMSGMFLKNTFFNNDISGWDVSNVQFMYGMFGNAKEFNQDLSRWDVSSVTDMFNMFAEANKFTSDLSSWDVSRVTDMEGMFYRCLSFNADLKDWNVAAVTNMDSMFFAASSFNADVTHWKTGNVENFREAFKRASAFDQDLCWDLSAVDKNDDNALFEVFTVGGCFNPTCISAYDAGVNDNQINVILDISGSFADCVANADSEPIPGCPPGAINLGGGLCICFPGEAQVQLEGGQTTTMDQLQLGDRVLVDDGTYSEVYSFGHSNANVKSEYIQIHSKDLEQPLELSANHLVFTNLNDAVPASQLNKGDTIYSTGSKSVVVIDKIETVTAKGAYAPFTYAGTIVVNDVMASSYIAMDHSKSTFELAGMPFVSHHWGAHISTAPLRLYCQYVASCTTTETYTPQGLSTMTAGPYVAGTWLMSLESGLLQMILFLPAFGIALLAAGLEQVLIATNSYMGAALVAAIMVYYRQTRTTTKA